MADSAKHCGKEGDPEWFVPDADLCEKSILGGSATLMMIPVSVMECDGYVIETMPCANS